MKLQQIIRKKPYLRPIIVGFTALYVMSMLLSTYLVKEKFEHEYLLDFHDKQYTIMEEFSLIDDEIYGESGSEELYFRNYLDMLLSPVLSMGKYNQFSAAIYDPDGNKVAQTSIMMTFRFFMQMYRGDSESYTGPTVFYFDLLEYLTEEEFTEFMQYYEDKTQYSVQAYIHEETGELAHLTIYTLKDGEYAVKQVWSWPNQNVDQYDPMLITPRSHIPFELSDPTSGYYKEWLENEYLQNYPDKIEKAAENQNDKNGITDSGEADIISELYLFHEDTGEAETYTLLMRHESHPWLAAMDYLKYVYLAGALLMIVCIIKVIYSTNKTYEQRAALEETRRDFTNAIAHELKTPLGVIRGFAENLKENTVEEKRDYYLDQIVGQTEEIDKMVREMIYISRLDSEQLVLKKEQVSMRNLIEEQLARLETAVEEKNLEIRYQIQEDFVFEGEKYYLEKALWNLISNAIEYNRQEGFIHVSIDSKECSIENSGTCIAEEDLSHVFDIFYTGDKSRNSKEKHLGLGLYLAKRILEMHHLELKIKNTKTGVKVTIVK